MSHRVILQTEYKPQKTQSKLQIWICVYIYLLLYNAPFLKV